MSNFLSKVGGRGGFIALFFVSLAIFVVASFPYGILKEYLSAIAAKELNIRFRAEELSPSFPIGVRLAKVTIDGENKSSSVELEEVEVGLSLLSLLTGKIGVDLEITSKNGGFLSGGGELRIADILSNIMIPSSVDFDAKKFPVGPLVSYSMYYLAKLMRLKLVPLLMMFMLAK